MMHITKWTFGNSWTQIRNVFVHFRAIEYLEEQLRKKDEQIERANNLVLEVLKQTTDSQAQANLSRIWSLPEGNL